MIYFLFLSVSNMEFMEIYKVFALKDASLNDVETKKIIEV